MEDLRKGQETIVIGIMGVHSGTGVTTMSVAMANYISAFQKKRVAIYEYNEKNHFSVMCEQLLGSAIISEDEGVFSYKKIDYYCKNSTDNVRLQQEGYDAVIVDFGSRISSIGEFLRCRHRIIMGSLEPWHYPIYKRFCYDMSDFAGSDLCLHILHGDIADITVVSKSLKICGVKRPEIDNPFIVNTDLIKFFQILF